jgi:hypothetical protein
LGQKDVITILSPCTPLDLNGSPSLELAKDAVPRAPPAFSVQFRRRCRNLTAELLTMQSDAHVHPLLITVLLRTRPRRVRVQWPIQGPSRDNKRTLLICRALQCVYWLRLLVNDKPILALQNRGVSQLSVPSQEAHASLHPNARSDLFGAHVLALPSGR